MESSSLSKPTHVKIHKIINPGHDSAAGDSPAAMVHRATGVRARAGIDYESSFGKAQPNDTILKLQRATPYYKRNRAHVCSFYVRGECTRGAECPYRHEMPETGELSQQNIKDCYYGMTIDANQGVERSDIVEDRTTLDVTVERRKNKRKKHLMKEAADAERRGVCYLSRVPPRMDPTKLRQIFSQCGEILRIYLAPEDPKAPLRRKQSGGFRGQEFSEGWVEFTKKTVAKRVAGMLNGEPIGGKKRSSFYYDLWNIKYLRKFKWDDLTEEIAYKKATRDQKLALELAAARRQCDFYLSKVDKSCAISAIQEKRLKKHKTKGNAELTILDSKSPDIVTERPKTVRKFRQTQPLAETVSKHKQELSRGVLLGVFGSK